MVRVLCIYLLCKCFVYSDLCVEFLGCVCARFEAWWFCIFQIRTFAACDWLINNLLYSLLLGVRSLRILGRVRKVKA